ncbi:molybdate transporter subunit; membrane component of ABC superfamily [uncultured spirochete]|uniref:Molybdenum transport system permease n=1 Tax=uncultured spirochete TaxID=156406 RepID=A0A3P3XM90_9SPIR|nr:molybdate transporter subunit; membrane component of ABC superfamily [uncultured spirochete]
MFDLSPLYISLRAAALSSAIVFVLGTVVARLCYTLRGRKAAIVDTILTLPLVLPPTVLGFFLLVLFGRNGPFGVLLARMGQKAVIFSWKATVIAAAVVSFPLMYRSARGAFEQIDQELLWAGRTLGMAEWKLFLHIMVPEAWPGLMAGLALSFSRSLGEFGATLMIAGNIPGKTQTIPMAIYFATAGGDMQTAWIWVGIIVAISCVSLTLTTHFDSRRRG